MGGRPERTRRGRRAGLARMDRTAARRMARARLLAVPAPGRRAGRARLDDAGRAHALETIERTARVQVRLVEDTLDVSRIVTGKLRLHFHAADLRAVSESAVDAVRPAADAKQVELRMRLDAAPVPVWG